MRLNSGAMTENHQITLTPRVTTLSYFLSLPFSMTIVELFSRLIKMGTEITSILLNENSGTRMYICLPSSTNSLLVKDKEPARRSQPNFPWCPYTNPLLWTVRSCHSKQGLICLTWAPVWLPFLSNAMSAVHLGSRNSDDTWIQVKRPLLSAIPFHPNK